MGGSNKCTSLQPYNDAVLITAGKGFIVEAYAFELHFLHSNSKACPSLTHTPLSLVPLSGLCLGIGIFFHDTPVACTINILRS